MTKAKFKVGDKVRVKRTAPKRLSSYIGKVGKVVRISRRKGRLYYTVSLSYPGVAAREEFTASELTKI